MSGLIEIPRLTLWMCARRILEEADERGFFHNSFRVGDSEFEVDCRLTYSPYPQDRHVVTGAEIYHGEVRTCGRDGYISSAVLTGKELIPYLKS
ncbi:MAG: hypothetical protein LUD76_06610 [Alistipes sp.]|nr:hypothetical protein [Alistipes sp.]